ncbi:MAG: S4 domain-containing protein, partial [bacterium]|nr:S4 domain-containing protein [bacterium]
MEHKVTKEYSGERLDAFLHSKYPDFSRNWIQKLIKKGNALVNSHKASASKKCKTDDIVIFNLELPPEISLEPDISLGEKIKIVFENDDFLIINKPSGISSHP